MSHFAVLVLTAEAVDPREAVARLLAPYEEALGQDPKWDWWTIGGRWTGMLDGYDPTKDPTNIETCDQCRGTGRRTDAVGADIRKLNPGFTCNGCEGNGRRVKWPTDWAPHAGDVARVDALPQPLRVPFAVVTPDGAWHERGRMGWWAAVADEKDRDTWADEVRALLDANPSATAVIVDCHI